MGKLAKETEKSALVLSGGGAKGAYEIGVLQALTQGKSSATGYQPLRVEVLTGTSVGAYNAAFLTAQTDLSLPVATDSLETIWRRRIPENFLECSGGVFRFRDGPLAAIDPECALHPLRLFERTVQDTSFWANDLARRGRAFLTSGRSLEARLLNTVNLASFISPQPLYKLISETIDLDALRRADKSLTVVATDWNAGKVKLFSRLDLADRVGVKGIAASTAIPGIFPAVEIDGISYHDGGVLLNTPILPAIRAGADVLHVIFLDPKLADIPLNPVPNTIDTIYRMFLVTQAAFFREDIATALSIQRELEEHLRMEIISQDCTEVLAGKDALGSNSRVLRRIEEGRPYRPLTIHKHRATTDLDGGVGLLNFSAKFIDELIRLGYEDTVRHDCAEAGCVIPEKTGS